MRLLDVVDRSGRFRRKKVSSGQDPDPRATAKGGHLVLLLVVHKADLSDGASSSSGSSVSAGFSLGARRRR